MPASPDLLPLFTCNALVSRRSFWRKLAAQEEFRDAVVVTDMATPMTYERYCGTFEGSYMTDWPPFSRLYHAPVRYRKGLYFTGQRTAYSGGLPLAAQSGRTTAQAVCKDFGLEFVNHY